VTDNVKRGTNLTWSPPAAAATAYLPFRPQPTSLAPLINRCDNLPFSYFPFFIYVFFSSREYPKWAISILLKCLHCYLFVFLPLLFVVFRHIAYFFLLFYQGRVAKKCRLPLPERQLTPSRNRKIRVWWATSTGKTWKRPKEAAVVA